MAKPALVISMGPASDDGDPGEGDEYAALFKKIREALDKKDDAMGGNAIAALVEECMKSDESDEDSNKEENK